MRDAARECGPLKKEAATAALFGTAAAGWDSRYDATPLIDKVQGFQLTGLGRAYGPPTSFNGSYSALLRNDDGVFTDISEAAGIQVRTPDLKVPVGKSLGVAPFDVDGDGLVDIAVANDTVQNFFFRNKGHGK